MEQQMSTTDKSERQMAKKNECSISTSENVICPTASGIRQSQAIQRVTVRCITVLAG
jgi:hypothetical protein